MFIGHGFVDLTGKARITWYVKTSGFHEVRPALKVADGTYLIGDHIDSAPFDWRESEFYLSEVHRLKAQMPKVLTTGKLLEKVDLSKVDEIGFADLTPGAVMATADTPMSDGSRSTANRSRETQQSSCR